MFCLVGSDGKFVSQRTHPKLATVRAKVGNHTAAFGAEGVGDVNFDLVSLMGNPRKDVIFHGDELVEGIDTGDEPAAMFSEFLQKDCRLVRIGSKDRLMEDTAIPCAFQDGFSVSLLSLESVAEMNRHFHGGYEIPAEQFRMSLVIRDEHGEMDPHFEDRIRKMRIRDVEFEFRKWTPRCAMVNVDQRTGYVDKRILTSLAGYRTFRHNGKNKAWFGSYLAHLGTGWIQAGDEVEVIAWQDPPVSEPR